jgi:hypothetical protein
VKEQLADITLTHGTFKGKLERAIRTIAIEEFAAATGGGDSEIMSLFTSAMVMGRNHKIKSFFLTASLFVLFTLSRLNLNSPCKYDK